MRSSLGRRDANNLGDQLQYQTLEPRQMLAGDLDAVVFSADFEDVEVARGQYAHVDSVSGFTATVAPVEIQNNVHRVGSASQGEKHLELDGVNGVSVQLNQQVEDGLVLRFDYSPRPGVRSSQNAVEVWWNGEMLNQVVGNGRRLRSTNFETYEFGLAAVASGNSTLEFRSNSPNDRDGLGGLIDNVLVFASSAFPQLNSIEDQTLTLGTDLNLVAELDSPVDDAVTFSILNGPTGLQIDSQSGAISWTAEQANVESSNAQNSVVNFESLEEVFQADFEDADVPSGSYQFFQSISGFESVIPGVGVEVQNNHASVGEAVSGQHLLELDGRNGVFRDVTTSADDLYQLELNYSPRPSVSSEMNEVQIWWGGALIETLGRDGRRLTGTSFTKHTIDLPR